MEVLLVNLKHRFLQIIHTIEDNKTKHFEKKICSSFFLETCDIFFIYIRETGQPSFFFTHTHTKNNIHKTEVKLLFSFSLDQYRRKKQLNTILFLFLLWRVTFETVSFLEREKGERKKKYNVSGLNVTLFFLQ